MALIWILIITVATFLLTISLVVVAQEVHPIAGFVAFAAIAFGSFKLFQHRFTRL
jgi:hypothetical protein